MNKIKTELQPHSMSKYKLPDQSIASYKDMDGELHSTM